MTKHNQVLVLLRGGVSPIARQYPSIRKIKTKQDRVSLEVVVESIRKHLIQTNPDYNFTFGIHSWDGDLSFRFLESYKPAFSQFEENERYRKKIAFLMLRSWMNAALNLDIRAISRIVRNPKAALAQDFSGISQAMSIQMVSRLALSSVEVSKFNWIIILRPDVVILSDIFLSRYDPGAITCNHHLDRCGDFRWIFSPEKLDFFANLTLGILRHRQVHFPHTWIRDYAHVTGRKYEQDSLVAGKDEEVLRKTASSGIAFTLLRPYGLKKEEYRRYDDAR